MPRLAALFTALLLLHTALAHSEIRAQDQTQRLVAKLSEEATAFERLAPNLLGQETLEQRALKPSGGIHLRIGAAATHPREPQWQQKTVVSEYGFAAFASEASPGVNTLHELRQVTSVDGRKVKESGKASAELAKVILAGDEARKRELLKQFEQYGLLGAANDFGQLLLLFSPSNILRYEFIYRNTQLADGVTVLVFAYRQIDGPNPLTVVDSRKQQTSNIAVEGEVWVDAQDYSPRRITLAAVQEAPTGGLTQGSAGIRQEATVEYRKSAYGVVLPFSTQHRELHGGQVVAENHFTYSNFKRFGSSTAIEFPAAGSGAVH